MKLWRCCFFAELTLRERASMKMIKYVALFCALIYYVDITGAKLLLDFEGTRTTKNLSSRLCAPFHFPPGLFWPTFEWIDPNYAAVSTRAPDLHLTRKITVCPRSVHKSWCFPFAGRRLDFAISRLKYRRASWIWNFACCSGVAHAPRSVSLIWPPMKYSCDNNNSPEERHTTNIELSASGTALWLVCVMCMCDWLATLCIHTLSSRTIIFAGCDSKAQHNAVASAFYAHTHK